MTAAPPLDAVRDAERVVIGWNGAPGAWVLETTDKIGQGSNWWPVRLAVGVDGSRHSVRVTPVAAVRYYRLATNDYGRWFQTTQGPLPALQMGVVLPHEHVFTDLRGPTTPGYGQADPDDVVRVMKPLLVEAREQGVNLLVECTGIGVGRDAALIQRLAKESGLPMLVPTGVYGRATFAPPEHRGMTEDALTELFIQELREGIAGTDIKAGFIKIATSESGMNALEEKFLRAAGRAARDTGAVIASHTALGSAAKKQADILEFISPSIRFIWVHAQNERNRKWHRDLAARGVYIEFDSLGWNPAEDSALIATIKELLAAGYGDRVLLSHDAGWYQPGQPNGGTQKPFTYLLETFLPKLRDSGVEEKDVKLLTEENPMRAFSFWNRQP